MLSLSEACRHEPRDIVVVLSVPLQAAIRTRGRTVLIQPKCVNLALARSASFLPSSIDSEHFPANQLSDPRPTPLSLQQHVGHSGSSYGSSGYA